VEAIVGKFESRRGEMSISTDKALLDLRVIHEFLSEESYWAKGRSMSLVIKTIENSLCFGVYENGNQVGFARVVTDYATFAWLCDVFIVNSHRGRGLGKWLIENVVAHPELQGLKNILLATQDGHELYRHYGGFAELEYPEKWMAQRKGVDFR